MNLLAYAARVIAAAVVNWAKAKIIDKAYDWAAKRGKAWLNDVFDWVVDKLTGKSATHWDKEDHGLAGAALEVRGLKGDTRSLADAILADIIDSPEGRARLERWLPVLDEESGTKSSREKWEIDTAPISRDLELGEWAAIVADRLGLTASYVLQRRLGQV
jgi:hypothetical protein